MRRLEKRAIFETVFFRETKRLIPAKVHITDLETRKG